MEDDTKYGLKLKEADTNIKNADYLLNTTYKIINDPKVLVNVLKKICDAFDSIISAILYRDREVKIISNFHDSSSSRETLFKSKFIKRYNFNKNIISTISKIKEILDEHNKSPMEFSRKKEFIICNSKFGFKKINYNETKEYLETVKDFFYQVSKLIQLNKFKEI